MSEGLHTALDVVGELADAANTALYLAQGDMANAALSASSMIPIVGNVTGAAKLARRGAKLLEKARGFKQVKQAWKSGVDLMEQGGAWAGKLQRGSTGFLGSPRLNRRQLQAFKEQAKAIGVELEVVKNKKIIREMDEAGAQAGFRASVNKIFVRKGATYYEVTHEMTHAKHFADLGKDAYTKLSALEKETYVYEQLIKQIDKLTPVEISHATKYINRVRHRAGLDPITS